MKAALYARVSTPGQGEEDKVSLPEQISVAKHYCQEKGYTVADVYVDVGYSGATTKRPEFQRMIADAKQSRYDVIVCWKADRLSRGMYPAAALMEATEPFGITIEATEERFDSNTFALLAVVGKIELDNIKARTRMGQEGRAKKGKVQAPPPFGYTYNKETGLFEILEDEAKVVRWIFDVYTQGTPAKQISATLNAAGIPTKTNSRFGWTVNKVSHVLSKPFYCGKGYYNRTTQTGGKTRKRDTKLWIPIEYPAIIPEDTFDLARGKKDANRRFSSGRSKYIYLLKGLLHCEECGMRFYLRQPSGDNKYRLVDGTVKVHHRKNRIGKYECRGSRDYPHIYNCRKPKYIRSTNIDPLVWDALDRVLRDPKMLKKALKTRSAQIKQDKVEESTHRKQVKDSIDKLKLEETWLITQARKGNITEDQMTLQMKSVREEREAWEAELQKVEAAKKQKINQEHVLKAAQETISRLVSRLDYLRQNDEQQAMEEKLAIVQLLVDKVTVNRDGEVTIQFAIPELVAEDEPIGAFDFTTPRQYDSNR